MMLFVLFGDLRLLFLEYVLGGLFWIFFDFGFQYNYLD